MVSRHIESFLSQIMERKAGVGSVFFRRGLAKVPYVPVPIRLNMSSKEEIQIWWSYVVPFFDASRSFFDYWGHDAADLQYLWRTLRPGMVFLDIGAHHGLYSLVAAKRLGTGGTVVSI